MRIPTAIIINDDNQDLIQLTHQLRNLVRVYSRNSLQGEQLYGIREGVIYYDDRGDKQLLHQDFYSDTLKQIQIKLMNISSPSRALLARYLEQRTSTNEHLP